MRDHPMVELPERSSLVNVDSGLRREHVGIHRAIGDVEGVQPVRPVPHTRRAAETVVELPADPLAGGKAHGWGPSRPRWYGEQRLYSGKDAQPTVGFTKLDVDLAQVFLDAMGLEAVSLMHADHVGKRGRHIRDSEADGGRVPTGGGLSSAGLFRPGRPYPLDGDFHGLHPCHSIENLTLCARLLRPAPTSPTTRKAEHLLRMVDPVDDTYRRQVNRRLTVQESRHKLACDVCHGKRGTIHQAYRDGMEDQPGALGLVLDAIVLWTTGYIDAAVAQLRAEGHEIRDEDIARLSPLKHRNLNSRPLWLHLLHPGRRRPAAPARPGCAGAGRGRRRGWAGLRVTDQGGDELAGPCLGQALRGGDGPLPGSPRLAGRRKVRELPGAMVISEEVGPVRHQRPAEVWDCSLSGGTSAGLGSAGSGRRAGSVRRAGSPLS